MKIVCLNIKASGAILFNFTKLFADFFFTNNKTRVKRYTAVLISYSSIKILFIHLLLNFESSYLNLKCSLFFVYLPSLVKRLTDNFIKQANVFKNTATSFEINSKCGFADGNYRAVSINKILVAIHMLSYFLWPFNMFAHARKRNERRVKAQQGGALRETFLINTLFEQCWWVINFYSMLLTPFFHWEQKFIRKAINAKTSLGVNSLASIIPIVFILFAIKGLLFSSLKNIKWVSLFRNL